MLTAQLVSSLIAAFTVFSTSASASFLQRAVSDLVPWVSVDASGIPVATVTPVLKTINGVATTIGAAPAESTAISTSQTDKKPTITSGAAPTSTGGGAFEVCFNMDGLHAPFCKPDNGSDVYVGEIYYVTWDTRYFTLKNASVFIQANYVNTTGGFQAFNSPSTVNAYGFYALTIDNAWLRGSSSNNITLFIMPLDPIANEPTSITGPTVRITTRPKNYYRQPRTKMPGRTELLIVIPSVLGVFILLVVGGCWWNKNERHIGIGNVMGRNRGYASGKSKSQRTRVGKADAIRLQSDLTSGHQYTDNTADQRRGGRRGDSIELGSLAGSPTDERPSYFVNQSDWQKQQKRNQ